MKVNLDLTEKGITVTDVDDVRNFVQLRKLLNTQYEEIRKNAYINAQHYLAKRKGEEFDAKAMSSLTGLSVQAIYSTMIYDFNFPWERGISYEERIKSRTKNYTTTYARINEDGTVDMNHTVNITNKKLVYYVE